MFLRKPLHMYLLWATIAFAALSFLSAYFKVGESDGEDSAVTTTTTTVPQTTTTFVRREYTVQNGDSLFTIAQKFNISAPALVELNKIKNPDRVPVGTVLLLPPSIGFVPIGATTTMPP